MDRIAIVCAVVAAIGLSGCVRNGPGRNGELVTPEAAYMESLDDIEVCEYAENRTEIKGRKEIRDLQSSLSALGYDAGFPDGIVGPRTRRAVTAYQRDMGLSTQGPLTMGLLEHLRCNVDVSAPSELAVSAPSVKPLPPPGLSSVSGGDSSVAPSSEDSSKGQSNPLGAMKSWLASIMDGPKKRILKDIPLSLSKQSFPEYPSLPGAKFKPSQLAELSATKRGGVLLAPGDWSIAVRLICMKSYASSPSAHQYTLSEIEGSRASLVRLLNLRTSGRDDIVNERQRLVWSLEAGLAYHELTTTERQLVDRFLPEHKVRLGASFLETSQKMWDRAAMLSFGRLPTFNEFVETHTGDFGRILRRIQQAREVILAYQDYKALASQLILPDESITLSDPRLTPWSEIQPGVMARLTTKEAFGGVGQLQVRVQPAALSARSTHVALPVTSLVANPGNSRIQPLALSPLVKIKESGEEDDLCPDGSLRKKSADSTSKIAKGLGLYATEGFRFPVSDLDGPLQRKLKDTWGASRSYRKGIHLGVDIYVPDGRQVVAITDGKVVSLRPSETKPGGNIVFVRDSGGYLWGYMHLKGYAEGLRKRQRVSAGTPLGKSGRTGIQRSDPHLHVDVRKRIPKGSAETAPANEFRMRVPKAKKKYDYEYVNIFSLLKQLDKQRQGHKVDDDGCP